MRIGEWAHFGNFRLKKTVQENANKDTEFKITSNCQDFIALYCLCIWIFANKHGKKFLRQMTMLVPFSLSEETHFKFK
jgi:hypothetical protein